MACEIFWLCDTVIRVFVQITDVDLFIFINLLIYHRRTLWGCVTLICLSLHVCVFILQNTCPQPWRGGDFAVGLHIILRLWFFFLTNKAVFVSLCYSCKASQLVTATSLPHTIGLYFLEQVICSRCSLLPLIDFRKTPSRSGEVLNPPLMPLCDYTLIRRVFISVSPGRSALVL